MDALANWFFEYTILLNTTLYRDELSRKRILVSHLNFHTPPYHSLQGLIRRRKLNYILLRISNYRHDKYYLNQLRGLSFKRHQTERVTFFKENIETFVLYW